MIKQLIWLIVVLGVANWGLMQYQDFREMKQPVIESKAEEVVAILPEMIPEELPVPTSEPESKPEPTEIVRTKPTEPPSDAKAMEGKWGVAQQIDEVTWTMRIESDERMATPTEILDALNDYRRRKGVAVLGWDKNLAEFAQNRADYFFENKTTDKHEGFKKYLDDGGFEKLGFTWVGENSSYGYHLEGVHLIEWVFAGDKPHDDNQSNSRWAYAGIGVRGTAVDIIFGTGKR